MFDDLAAAPVQRGQCLLGVPLDRRQHGLFSGVIGLPHDFGQPGGFHASGLQLRKCCAGLNRTKLLHVADEDHASVMFVSRSEEHTSELQSLMRISYAVFCLKKKKKNK